MNGWTPERLSGFLPENPPEAESVAEAEWINRRELMVSGVLWSGLVASVFTAVSVDTLDKAYDSLVITSKVSRQVVAHTPFLPQGTRKGSEYIGHYGGEKANIGVSSLLNKVSDGFTLNEDPTNKFVDQLFAEPYGSTSVNLDFFARGHIGMGVGLNQPLDPIRNPENLSDRQKERIKLLESRISDDLKEYKKDNDLSDKEYESNYDRIFANVISKKLGLDNPPEAAHVLGIFAKSYHQNSPLNDQEFTEVQSYYLSRP